MKSKMAEPPQKKLRYSVAEQTVNHINGRSLSHLINEEQYWMVRDRTFEHTPLKELLALRKTSKLKQQQVDRYLRTVRYKNWNLPADQLFLNIGIYTFFDFDPRYSIELQLNTKFEKIFIFRARSISDVPNENNYQDLFNNNFLNDRVYLIIPLNCKEINFNAFSPGVGKESCITKVWTPPSLQHINQNAFRNCTNLKKFRIPSHLEIIDHFAFGNCKKLEDVTFPSSLRYLGKGCFSDTGLKSVEFKIPSRLKTIGEIAFNNCINLKDVTLPSSVINIGKGCFANAGLESVKFEIPSKLEKIDELAFSMCVNLTDVTFPSSLRNLGRSCFSNTGLESVKFRDSQISDHKLDIGESAFLLCRSLKDLILPSHKTIIRYKAFEGTGLEEIVIPPNVVKLEFSCFAECEDLRSVDIQANIDNIELYSFFNCQQLHTVSLPQSVNTIGDFAFSRTALGSIDLGPNIKEIQREAFSSTKLTRIHFSKNLLYIYPLAFYNSELKHVIFSPEIDVDDEEFTISDKAFLNAPIETVECSYKLFQKCKRSFSKTKTEQIRFHFYGERPDLVLNKSSLQEP